MNQGTARLVNYDFSRLLVSVVVLLVSACAADEPEHLSALQEKPAKPEPAIQVREWYPTPKHQDAPYYVFAPVPGQGMQQQQIIAAPPVQQGQGYAPAGQYWQPAPYPAQQAIPQYPGGGGWSGYGQAQQQAIAQPQPYPPAPQYQQPYQPVPQYQPYSAQPQYQPAQRPWGVPGNTRDGSAGARQSIDTWQTPGQYPGWNPPAYNGYTGQFGTPQNYAVPEYSR
jgi:hypothetical protein